MSVLSPSGLETADYGTQGWNAIYSSNFQKLNSELGHLMSSHDNPGTIDQADNAGSQADPAATTAETMTDSTGGTASQTVSDVGVSHDQTTLNNNFASLVDEINKLRADNVELRSKLIGTIDYCDALKTTINGLLVKLRKSTGIGALSN